MAYASWSVVYGEQPSAAKWNILGTNDSFFNDQVGSNFGSGTTSTVWWEEIGRTTLTGAGDSIAIASMEARKYLRILIKVTGPNVTTGIRFNSDSGSNYTRRNNANDTESTSTSETNLVVATAGNVTYDWIVCDVVNIASEEKLVISSSVGFSTAGAGTAPSRKQLWGKWVNTSAQITAVDVINTGTGDFAIGSEVVVLGHD